MILWTIQPKNTLDIIKEKGVFTCDTTKSEWYNSSNEFHRAYDWLVKEMDNRGIYHPKELQLPLWAWHTIEYKHQKPDYYEMGFGKEGDELICIEFEISDNEVLLSDFDNWLLILNNDFVTECNNGKEWDEEQQWLDNLPEDKRKTAIINSWQRIFNLEAVNNDIRIAGSYIQATFWQLKKEMIRKVEYFTLTKHYHIF